MANLTVFLRFSTQAEADQVAKFIKRGLNLPADDPTASVFDHDGYFAPVVGGQAYYYNFDLCFGTGIVYSTFPTGTKIDPFGNTVPTYTLRPGVHVNMLWTGPESALPSQISTYRVYPVHPAVTFG